MFLADCMKRWGWQAGLVPFVKCVAVYWASEGAGGDDGGASGGEGVDGGVEWGDGARRAAAKCAPVLSLLLFVILQRANRSDAQARRYSLLVCVGLALSALGDALLVWDRLAAGMAAFGLAHVCYCAAYGGRPRRLPLAALLAAGAAAYCQRLRPPAALRPLVPPYALLLSAAAWRGVARADRGVSGRCSAAGGLLFLLSDAVLAWSLFNGPVPYKQLVVMSSYYLAQLFIALSAVLLAVPPQPRAPSLVSPDSRVH